MGDDNRRGFFNHAPNIGTQVYYEAPQIGPGDILKRDLRNLLAAADTNILFEIDSGNLDIETRMTTAQFARLEQLAATAGSAALIVEANVTGRYTRSSINDGSFGPNSTADQIRVKFKFTGKVKE